jgi:exodeoxyribonuclease V gamma subunit
MAPYRGTVELAGIAVEGAVHADPVAGHLFRVTASRIKGKQRLRIYAELAFLTALHPDVAWQAVVVGRRPEGEGHLAMKVLQFGPAATPASERRAKAVDRLAELVALYVEGHRAPLPLPCESAFAWQRALAFKDRDKAVWALRDSWETGRFTESRDAAHRTLLGDLARADDLLASGFEEYCARLWLPVLAQTTEKPL